MTKILRVKQEIFANQAGSRQITAFGTAKSETPNFTTDLAQIQNTNFLYGWASALLPDKSPWEEDMNALFYAITKQLAYLFQEGIPEYDPNTEYSQNAFVKGIGSNIIYCSKVPENLGNPLTNSDYWTVYNSGGGLASYEIGLPQPTFSNKLFPNEIWLEGDKVAKNLYPNLTAIYGDIYAPSTATDTDTYLYLPDCRNRVFWGATDFGYISAGLPNITGSFTNCDDNYATGAFYVTKDNLGTDDGSRPQHIYGFDASLSNPIYGNSPTVQPPAIKVRIKTRYE